MDRWPKITLFGDSITRYAHDADYGCWASMLAHQVLNYYQVDVKGFSGYTTKWALQLVPKLFTPQYLADVEYFIIFFGHNDAWDPEKYPTVTPAQYKDNLIIMIKLLIEDGLSKDKIMLITPGWFDEPSCSKWQIETYGGTMGKTFEHSRKYVDATIEVAREFNISLVDWWKVTTNYQPLEELFYDGLHLSTKGAKLLFDTLWPELRATIEAKHGRRVEELYRIDIPRELLDWMLKYPETNK